MQRTGGVAGEHARRMFDLDDPDLNWVGLADGRGVAGARATTAGEFRAQLRAALAEGGRHLIEAVVP